MLSNGRVHDTDGFLFDGEKYALQHLKVKKAGAACSRLAFCRIDEPHSPDIMKYNRKEVPPYGS